MAKYKKDDRLVVTGDRYGMGHPFGRSTWVSVLKVHEYDGDAGIYQCKATGQPGAPWWVHESDLMPEPPSPMTQPFGQPERPEEEPVHPGLAAMVKRGLEREGRNDAVDHPKHYTWGPVEVIEITEHLGFCLGNVVKYVLRADHKGKPIEDLKKARWYLDREIARREKEGK